MELLFDEQPTTEQIIQYNQKVATLQAEISNRLHEGRRQYEPVQEILDDLIHVLQSYKEQ